MCEFKGIKETITLPDKRWTTVPITIIFGAVLFRMSWNITAEVNPVQVLWWLVIIATITAYIFIIRLVFDPNAAEKLASVRVRMGIATGITVGMVIATMYLYQQASLSVAIISKLVLGLAIAVNICGYFLAVILIKPGIINKLKTRTVQTGVTIGMTAALVCLTIHTVRFVPSPEALQIRSKVMAILLLASLIVAYPLILNYFRCVWRR